MPIKVKRGLGLLVLAIPTFGLLMLLVQIGSDVTGALALLTLAGFVGLVATGLGLVAWGLLRD